MWLTNDRPSSRQDGAPLRPSWGSTQSTPTDWPLVAAWPWHHDQSQSNGYVRWSAVQSVLVSGTVATLLGWGFPSLRTGRACSLQLLLGFPSAGLSGSSPTGLMTQFTASDSRLHQLGRPSLFIYIVQEHGIQIIPPGTGFQFLRLLRFIGLRRRHETSTHFAFFRYEVQGAVHQDGMICGKTPVVKELWFWLWFS
jgi:hypothetical protein